jgi:hypothetical protein
VLVQGPSEQVANRSNRPDRVERLVDSPFAQGGRDLRDGEQRVPQRGAGGDRGAAGILDQAVR